MCALFLSFPGYRSHQVNLAVLYGRNHYNAFSKLFFQLIAKIPQAVHIHVFYLYGQELYAVNFLYLVHDIAKGIISQLAL